MSISVEELLLTVEELIQLYYSKAYIIKRNLDVDKNVTGLVMRDMNIHYDKQDSIFYITFPVGTTGKIASELTKILCSVINYEYLYTIDDYFWDNDNNEMLFGTEAIHKKYESHLQKSGKTTCPMCDRVLEIKYLEPSGICPVCEKYKADVVWN